MLRTTSTRPLFKSLCTPSSPRITSGIASRVPASNAQLRTLSAKRPQPWIASPLRPGMSSSVRYATNKNGPPFDVIDTKEEQKIANTPIEPSPETVSGASSVRHVFEGSQAPPKDDDDMLAGMKNDIKTVKETFALEHVPRESLLLGAAGVLPYLGTSLSTAYLAFDITHASTNGSGYLFSPETAHQLLSVLEPIQVGYGAVIISFLGAIHWGLEYAGYGGKHSYRRYAIGVVAPAIAWPTMLMPVEYALISQFLAFNFLYFTDARATVRGWCPPWYSTYRFVLTFIVGASIVVSLVGRGQISGKVGSFTMEGPAAGMKELRDSQWENLEREERERRAKLAAEEDAENDDGSEEEHQEEKKNMEAQNKKEGDAHADSSNSEPKVKADKKSE